MSENKQNVSFNEEFILFYEKTTNFKLKVKHEIDYFCVIDILLRAYCMFCAEKAAEKRVGKAFSAQFSMLK